VSRRRRVVLAAVTAGVVSVYLLVGECTFGGNMGARYMTCECLGVEAELYDGRPADGPHKTVCLGLVRSRTCYQMTDGPVVECQR
jgi:ABC-type transporter Mla maintaining outer membrane lipid asymmetry permease subunit MlaE